MSKLAELLEKVKVEWTVLGEVCKIETGKLNANQEKNDGKYLFFTCDELPKKIDVYTHDTEAILISGNGSRLGHVTHYIGKFNAYQRTYILNNFSTAIDVRYLFFILLNGFREHANQNKKPGSVPYIVLENVSGFKIPVPCPENPKKSLEIQKEIVRILDTFTERTETLINELTAELEARKKQYNYYREKLLSFKEGEVEWKTLGEIGEVHMCKRIFKEQTSDVGEIPFYKIGTFGKEANAYITRELFNEYKSKYNYPRIGEVLISASGTIGRSVIFDGSDAYFQDSNIVWIENDEGQVLNKYLFYVYQIVKWEIAEGGTIQRLYNDNLKKTKIPIPFPNDSIKSLEEQARIVYILDKLESLTTSISEALPKEITLRKKQYEYYRDRLLTFK